MSEKETKARYLKKEMVEMGRSDKNFVRVSLSIIVFGALSIGLSYFKITPDILPRFITIDFSVFAELLASIAYGPIIGIAVCLLKSAIRVFINSNAFYSIVMNFFVNSAFVGVAGFYYYRKVLPRKNNRRNENNETRRVKEPGEIHRRKTIIVGSLLGTIPALIIQFIMINKYVFPKFNWYYKRAGYSYENILLMYEKSADWFSDNLPGILGDFFPHPETIWGNSLLFNTPVTFFKFMFVAIILAIVYPYISPYLHFRKIGK